MVAKIDFAHVRLPARKDLQDDEYGVQLREHGEPTELPRRFSSFAMIGLAFSILNSWAGYTAAFTTPLEAGGAPVVFWAPLVASFACLIITTGLAELASAFPSNGGQYHHVYMVAPPKARAVLAFPTAWLSIFGWLFTDVSAAFFVAQLCVGIAQFYYEGLTVTAWQMWLIYTLVIILAAVCVCFLPRLIPLIESSLFWLSLGSFIASLVAMLASSQHKQSASFVFTQWSNQTGWSDGTAFLLAVGQSMWPWIGTDAATHISEETPNPGRSVPRAMWLSVVIGTITILPYTLAMLFSIQDMEAVSDSALPIREVYLQALQSTTGATLLLILLVLIFFGGVVGVTVTSGRLIWAFARNNGLPYSNAFARTDPKLQTPVNATLLTASFCIIYGLLYVASTQAFNSFIATAILTLNITYAVPQGIVLWRGRDMALPPRQFDLGRRFGTFCNVFSCAWVALYAVLFCFPIKVPVQAGSMNYVSGVMGGMAIFISAMWWFRGHGQFMKRTYY
ncbi:hypothetical protein ASPZODRAFT_54940 [Penicilliopsis zonata CBS 506.65]|uniref:Amino acid permease/ SLC12A domain-containing protein n=1 Tax=Penicilliopsis zonata CBS 506.65 TaxID=1073090 RepID=A0A1L9SU65_9EURO|nr:hypothetical protein ASPZODRAFT_54940 [Penicilliopsis zonata CBS 506.65]OJJ50750.1 hypothetical protein ASPZODRAFT_54940 [Penicilliopsis zonata CBS 506.65]